MLDKFSYPYYDRGIAKKRKERRLNTMAEQPKYHRQGFGQWRSKNGETMLCFPALKIAPQAWSAKFTWGKQRGVRVVSVEFDKKGVPMALTYQNNEGKQRRVASTRTLTAIMRVWAHETAKLLTKRLA